MSFEDNEDTKLLMKYGVEHEDKIIKEIQNKTECVEPNYADKNYDEGYRATRELMKKGVSNIYQAVLFQDKEISNMIEEKQIQFPGLKFIPFYRGIPDILERKDGSSNLGDYHYVVGDIKSSKKPKPHQKMQVAFYSWLLSDIQGRIPDTGYIIPITGEKEYFDIDLYWWMLKDFLEEEIFEIALKENPFYHYTGSCENCEWCEHCKNKAEGSNDISLLPGLQKRQKKILARNKIHTISDAAEKMNVNKLSSKWGLGKSGLERIKLQAKSTLSGEKIVKIVRLYEGSGPDFTVTEIKFLYLLHLFGAPG